LVAKHVENEPAIAFRTIGEEDFVVGDVNPASPIINLRDLAPQEFIALLMPVATKSLAHGKLIYGRLHRCYCGGRQRFGHVADTATD